MASGERITVLNPEGFPPAVTAKPLPPRLGDLDGKTVYLVDCRFDDSDDWVHDAARMRADEYWDYQLAQNYLYPRATAGEEPYASKLRAAPHEPTPMFRREDVHVVVVGGETNGYWRIMGCNYQQTASIDDWR